MTFVDVFLSVLGRGGGFGGLTRFSVVAGGCIAAAENIVNTDAIHKLLILRLRNWSTHYS
jgi:hypothetical protein